MSRFKADRTFPPTGHKVRQTRPVRWDTHLKVCRHWPDTRTFCDQTQCPRVCFRQSNVRGQFYMLFKLYRRCVKMFHINHEKWILYRLYFVDAGKRNIIDITDRLFSAWGHHSLLSPDALAFLKSQKGYLWAEAATVNVVTIARSIFFYKSYFYS